MFSTKEIADALGVSGQSIRTYTGEFADYLSDDATPPPGGRRRFTDDDLRTLRAAKSLLDRGLTYDGVRGRLAQGVHTVETEEPEPREEPETAAPLVPMGEAQAWARLADEWRAIADDRRQEIEDLRLENRRLREEVQQRRPWWKFWS